MPMHVKTGGVWREVAPQAKVGGTWRPLQAAYVRVAGVWQSVYTALSVSLTNLVDHYYESFGTSHSGYQFNSDGTLYRTSSSSTFTVDVGDWLTAGSASDVWFERVITAGFLDLDPGTGRLNLGTTRSFRIGNSGDPESDNQCTLTINLYDAASGGNLLATKSITLEVFTFA